MMIEYYKNGLLGIEKYHGVISIVEEFLHNLIIKGDFRLSEISDSIE